MPRPNPGESEKDFVDRCVPIVIDEGHDPDQAVAKCHGIWNQHQQKAEARMKEHPLVLDFVLSSQWAIKQDALLMMVDIVKNGGNEQLAAAIRERRPKEVRYAQVLPNGVGILPIHGPMIPRASMFDEISGATNTAALLEDFEALMEDPSVDSIVLDVDSPGGVVTGIAELSERIFNAKDKKRVTAYVSGIGASAAYWVLSAAARVVMSPTAEVGSIGIMHLFLDDSKQMEDSGIKQIEIISSLSPKKNMNPTTPDGRAEMQRRADDLYEVMAEAIAKNRGVAVKDVVSGFGEGGMFVAKKAVERKMADAVMTFDDLMKEENADNETRGAFNMTAGATSSAAPKAEEEIKTADALKAKYPSLCLELITTAKAEGAKSENERITALESVPAVGFEDIVKAAKADTKVTKEALAYSILEEQKRRSDAKGTAVKTDAEKLSAKAAVVGGEPETPEEGAKAVIAAMVAGGNSKRPQHPTAQRMPALAQ